MRKEFNRESETYYVDELIDRDYERYNLILLDSFRENVPLVLESISAWFSNFSNVFVEYELIRWLSFEISIRVFDREFEEFHSEWIHLD